MTAKILIIDDDVLLCEVLNLTLTRLNFRVKVAHDAITGLQKAYEFKPDAIVLDIMMSGMNGWQACCRFREMTDAPIIMLTALGGQKNIVKALNLGADSYVVKPVTPKELAARIRAILRRAYRPNGKSNKQILVLTQNNLKIDLDKHEVTLDGKRVELSPTEFRLLSVLARYRGRLLSHKFLLKEVWGKEYEGEVDCLRLYISYLRRKIEKAPSNSSLIYNEWGTGYRFG